MTRHITQSWWIFCLILGLNACGPQNAQEQDTPKNQEPPSTQPNNLPDAAYIGTIDIKQDGQIVQKRAHLTLFQKSRQHEGTLFVLLDESTQDYAIYPTTVQTQDDRLKMSFGAPSCSIASACQHLGAVAPLTGTLQRESLTFARDAHQAGIQRITLTIDPDLYSEPDDGIRPSDSCEDKEGKPCEQWPPPLKDRPDDFMIYGAWDGHVFILPKYHQLYAAQCELHISDRGDSAPLFESMACLNIVDQRTRYQDFTTHHVRYNQTPRATLITWLNGRIWRFDGTLNAQHINQDKHKLYRFYGHVEVSEPVEESTDPDEVQTWHTAGTFAFTSWGH